MNITEVCISRVAETSSFNDVPFYCHVEGWKPFGHEKTKHRIKYLAERRNAAVIRALSLFPQTEHILMIDSYYLQQRAQISSLIREYSNMTSITYPRGCIVGASTWILDKTRIRPRIRFYDNWTTPEGAKLRLGIIEKKGGTIKVRAVGGCYLFPKFVFERYRYGVPEDLHGCEHNWLCEQSGLPVILSLDQRLWRDPMVYPWPKRVRVSLHLGRLLGR